MFPRTEMEGEKRPGRYCSFLSFSPQSYRSHITSHPVRSGEITLKGQGIFVHGIGSEGLVEVWAVFRPLAGPQTPKLGSGGDHVSERVFGHNVRAGVVKLDGALECVSASECE